MVVFIFQKVTYALNVVLKDGFEFSNFKSYVQENGLENSLDTISGETGISVKNLNRFLGYEEFKGFKNTLKNKTKNINNINLD